MSDRFDHTLELTHKPKPDADEGGAGNVQVRRIELITGPVRRRQWSDDDKARIIVESLKPGANVSAVARQHGLSPQQLFGWRREARELFSDDAGAPGDRLAQDAGSGAAASAFTPVVLAPVVPAARTDAGTPPAPPPAPVACTGTDDGVIEIVIGKVVVRVVGAVTAEALDIVLAAIRRSS